MENEKENLLLGALALCLTGQTTKRKGQIANKRRSKQKQSRLQKDNKSSAKVEENKQY